MQPSASPLAGAAYAQPVPATLPPDQFLDLLGRLPPGIDLDQLARETRAYSPWPGSYTTWHGKLLKILGANALATPEAQSIPPGTVMLQKESGTPSLQVATGEGVLALDRLQLEGKKAMNADEFLRGYANIVGDVLGK